MSTVRAGNKGSADERGKECRVMSCQVEVSPREDEKWLSMDLSGGDKRR